MNELEINLRNALGPELYKKVQLTARNYSKIINGHKNEGRIHLFPEEDVKKVESVIYNYHNSDQMNVMAPWIYLETYEYITGKKTESLDKLLKRTEKWGKTLSDVSKAYGFLA